MRRRRRHIVRRIRAATTAPSDALRERCASFLSASCGLALPLPTRGLSTLTSEQLAPTPEQSMPAPELSVPVPEQSASTPQPSTPTLQLSTLTLQQSTPTPQLSTPTLQQSTPTPQLSTSTLQQSTPTLFGSKPPQNESASMFEVSVPGFCSPAPRSGTPESALQVAAPASGRPSAAVQVPVPTLETSTSTLQLSTPTHFGATAPQNESKKAVRERVTPPATGRMTPPLPGRTRRRPPPGGGLASSGAGEIRRLRQAPECRPGVSRLPSFRAAGDPGGFDPCPFRRNDPDPSAAGMRSSPCIFRLSS